MKNTILFLLVTAPAFAAFTPIPRTMEKHYLSEGVFVGGGSAPQANLADIRFFAHQKEGYERLVIDFSDIAHRQIGTVAPAFQIRYAPAEKVPVPNQSDIVVEPPRFVITFKGIQRSYLTRAKIAALAKHSRHVSNIIVYPPIEGGDTAMEIVLRDSVLFETHQPTQKEGRLVLDLKNAPLGK